MWKDCDGDLTNVRELNLRSKKRGFMRAIYDEPSFRSVKVHEFSESSLRPDAQCLNGIGHALYGDSERS